MAKYTLGTTETANANYPSNTGIALKNDAIFMAYGTWDTATATLQVSPDEGTTWFAAGTDTTLTADGAGVVQVGFHEIAPIRVRVNLSSVGGSTSLNFVLFDKNK